MEIAALRPLGVPDLLVIAALGLTVGPVHGLVLSRLTRRETGA
ncbi:hypothetical protein [Nocardioides sp. Iso805N]|nr:hypothetical protein [Nocardioides sp. Iso805N]